LGVWLFGLSAAAQFSAALQIAATTNNQVVLSVSSNALPSLYNLQSATSLTPPIQWSSVSVSWGLQSAVPVTGPQQFFRVLQSVPVFELAIFYNLDMEMNPGSIFTINGPVHCNGNIYATGASAANPLTFADRVEATQQVNLFRSPLDPSSPRSGNVVFSITNNNPLNNAAPLYVPIGTTTTNNPVKILGLPPAGTDPTSSAGQAYFYYQADIVISNSATTNLSVYYQNFNFPPTQTLLRMDVTNIVSQTTNTYYSFVTNVTFYDYREAKTVQAVQLDAAKFNKWLTNSSGGLFYQNRNLTGITSKGHGINIVYVYNSITNSSSQLPAVRVINGQQLSFSGLSVATPFPLYVKGNYNTTTNGVNFSTTLGDTTNTYPAALMGDAITVLSANWNDVYNAATSLSSRNPTSTTINAATLQGIVPSDGTNYSGGVESILRLLENWSPATTLTYNGSIVVMFQSQYATSFWRNSNYYSVPDRRWGFDLKFLNQSKLPPGTPMIVNQSNP
jgi:hypothetical protein